LEKLLNRRQRSSEAFHTFALEMDMQYRKVYNKSPDTPESDILLFVAERSLPHLRIPLLGCGAKTIVDLINFGKKIDGFSHATTSPQRLERPQETRIAEVRRFNKPTQPPTKQLSYQPTNQPSQQSTNQPIKRKLGQHCDNCPQWSNHSTKDCFVSKMKTPQRVAVAQTINPSSEDTKNVDFE
jgi:hypothetical protein